MCTQELILCMHKRISVAILAQAIWAQVAGGGFVGAEVASIFCHDNGPALSSQPQPQRAADDLLSSSRMQCCGTQHAAPAPWMAPNWQQCYPCQWMQVAVPAGAIPIAYWQPQQQGAWVPQPQPQSQQPPTVSGTWPHTNACVGVEAAVGGEETLSEAVRSTAVACGKASSGKHGRGAHDSPWSSRSTCSGKGGQASPGSCCQQSVTSGSGWEHSATPPKAHQPQVPEWPWRGQAATRNGSCVTGGSRSEGDRAVRGRAVPFGSSCSSAGSGHDTAASSSALSIASSSHRHSRRRGRAGRPSRQRQSRPQPALSQEGARSTALAVAAPPLQPEEFDIGSPRQTPTVSGCLDEETPEVSADGLEPQPAAGIGVSSLSAAAGTSEGASAVGLEPPQPTTVEVVNGYLDEETPEVSADGLEPQPAAGTGVNSLSAAAGTSDQCPVPLLSALPESGLLSCSSAVDECPVVQSSAHSPSSLVNCSSAAKCQVTQSSAHPPSTPPCLVTSSSAEEETKKGDHGGRSVEAIRRAAAAGVFLSLDEVFLIGGTILHTP